MPPIDYSQLKKLAPWVAVALILVFGLGLMVGLNIGNGKIKAVYQSGWTDAKSKIEAAGLLPKTGPVSELTGQIVAIQGEQLTLKINQPVTNPLDTPAPTSRTVTLAKDTVVKISYPMSQTEIEKANVDFQAAMAQYAKQAAAGKATEPPAPPQMSMTIDGQLTDLKPDLTVTVTADGDILYAENFAAKEILAYLPSAPTSTK